MILNLKTPVYDAAGDIMVGESANYDEVCAFVGKFVKQHCHMMPGYLAPIGCQSTLFHYRDFSLYYNSEDKTLKLSPSTAFYKFFQIKGWNEVMKGGIAHV